MALKIVQITLKFLGK